MQNIYINSETYTLDEKTQSILVKDNYQPSIKRSKYRYIYIVNAMREIIITLTNILLNQLFQFIKLNYYIYLKYLLHIYKYIIEYILCGKLY